MKFDLIVVKKQADYQKKSLFDITFSMLFSIFASNIKKYIWKI